MPKAFEILKLEQIAIIGVGLLGGSIGMALRAAGFAGRRVGIGRRKSSLDKALRYDAVDEVTLDMARGLRGAGLVILCTPVSTFERLLQDVAPHLAPRTLVTDVASTKNEVVRIARRLLPKGAAFVGSHPMAGSEKTGVEFARADLFERALCIVTPTGATPPAAMRQVKTFWKTLGGRTVEMAPRTHDERLARVSHLPHAIATALVHLSLKQGAIELAGPGFADVTRIASGDPGMWTDILRSNRDSMIRSVDRLIGQLEQLRDRLDTDDEKALLKWLSEGKVARDAWVDRRYKKKVLPP